MKTYESLESLGLKPESSDKDIEHVAEDMKKKKDIDGLIKIFEILDQSRDVTPIMNAIVYIGKPAVEFLTQALKNDPIVVFDEDFGLLTEYRAHPRIAEALGKIGDDKAVEHLIQVLEDGVLDDDGAELDLDKSEFIEKTVEALEKIGDKRALDTLSKLAKILKGIEIETTASENLRKIVKVAIDRIKARDHIRTENTKRKKSKK